MNFPVKVPPQITRLALLTALIVVTYLIARYFLVPESFGEYGWYRGNALREIAALPTTFAGEVSCADCHAEVAETKARGKHAGLSCETCHGPLGFHAEDPTLLPPKQRDYRFCLRCHENNPSRPAAFPQIDVADHAGTLSCLTCHQPHHPTEAP